MRVLFAYWGPYRNGLQGAGKLPPVDAAEKDLAWCLLELCPASSLRIDSLNPSISPPNPKLKIGAPMSFCATMRLRTLGYEIEYGKVYPSPRMPENV